MEKYCLAEAHRKRKLLLFKLAGEVEAAVKGVAVQVEAAVGAEA
jgi:hypothetical protein